MEKPLLRLSRLKVAWANAHLDNLEKVFRGFQNYRFVGKRDTQTGKETVALSFTPVPDEYMIIVGEIAYHLRSSLDWAAVALARFAGAKNVDPVYFPFSGSASEFALPGGHAQKKMSLLPEPSKLVISDLKPYGGGNDLLVFLNRLCNTDKHIELISSASLNAVSNLVRSDPYTDDLVGQMTAAHLAGHMAAFAIETGGGLNDGFEFDLSGTRIALEDALAAMNKHTKLAVDVCFAKPGLFQNEPVIPTLHQVSRHVSEVLYLLEASAS